MIFNIVFSNKDDHSRNFSFLIDKDENWRYAPAYDLTYIGASNHGIELHQLTIDAKPSSKLRMLSLKKIAKLSKTKNYMQIIAQMIEIKRKEMPKIFGIYNIQYLSDMILNDTQVKFAKKAGIANATYGKFERTGEISFIDFLKVLRHLGKLKAMSEILAVEDIEKLGVKEYLKKQKKGQ